MGDACPFPEAEEDKKPDTGNISKNGLVVVSNRLPVVLVKEDDHWRVDPGSGGLVTALAPVLRNRGGIWIGWPGISEEPDMDLEALLKQTTRDTGYTFKPVSLTKEDVNGFYYGFANEVLWPLFHDLQTRCNFDPDYWRHYLKVNRKFAEVIARNTTAKDYIWVHDYHLMCVAGELRDMGVESKIGYFLHTPFPPLDLFLKLPWRFQILKALLSYDLVGLQTQRDRRNFIQCIRKMLRNIPIRGKGQILTAAVNHRKVRIGNFPISIDYNEFAQKAVSREVSERSQKILEELSTPTVALGVDRLDYTKGIPERLRAFENALDRSPELRKKISLVQVVVPSRTHIPKYRDLKLEIEREVSRINGRYTQPGWIPIHYIFRSLDREELLAFYRAADIALITPLKDGMNLIAKEYCASNVDEHGVIVLSEFAGAAAQMHKNAMLVNPYDVEGVAETIYTAYRLDLQEKKRRMHALRQGVRKTDIYWWVDAFIQAVFSRKLKTFPPLADYIPTSMMDTT
jgi:trehalose 6-phosphate synthase